MLQHLDISLPHATTNRLSYGIYFSSSQKETVLTDTFLCFIKNYWATRFRLIKPSLGLTKTWIKQLYVTWRERPFPSCDVEFLNLCLYTHANWDVPYKNSRLSHITPWHIYVTWRERPFPSCDVEFLNSCLYTHANWDVPYKNSRLSHITPWHIYVTWRERPLPSCDVEFLNLCLYTHANWDVPYKNSRLSHITPWHIMQTTSDFQTRERRNFCP
jgi:hypothetical protein